MAEPGGNAFDKRGKRENAKIAFGYFIVEIEGNAFGRRGICYAKSEIF